MNYALILAGGVGQRMRNSGMPKQFLEVYGKPIIIYTLQKFERCDDVDEVVISCNAVWMDHMKDLVKRYGIKKVKNNIIAGGKDRQDSVLNGIKQIVKIGGKDDDIVIIHDGVRPLIETAIISENVRVAKKYGSAMTVRPVIESVVITNDNTAKFQDFMKRDDTYSLTAPQTFKLKSIIDTYRDTKNVDQPIPLLDTALAYTFLGNDVHLVKESNHNLKITTPEDYYILKAMLELEENKFVFGLA